jgi:hypothetical protein
VEGCVKIQKNCRRRLWMALIFILKYVSTYLFIILGKIFKIVSKQEKTNILLNITRVVPLMYAQKRIVKDWYLSERSIFFDLGSGLPWLHIQCYRQWAYRAPLCITLKIKFPSIKKYFILVRTLQCFWKKFRFIFAPKKLKKPPSKVAQKYSNPLFFLTASTAQMAQTEELCSKMWPIDQLYIELGLHS